MTLTQHTIPQFTKKNSKSGLEKPIFQYLLNINHYLTIISHLFKNNILSAHIKFQITIKSYKNIDTDVLSKKDINLLNYVYTYTFLITIFPSLLLLPYWIFLLLLLKIIFHQITQIFIKS